MRPMWLARWFEVARFAGFLLGSFVRSHFYAISVRFGVGIDIFFTVMLAQGSWIRSLTDELLKGLLTFTGSRCYGNG